MKQMLLVVLLLGISTLQCRQAAVTPDPIITRLVGTWQLTSAGNDSTAGSTLIFSLDTANPPHDITSFDVRGKGPVRTFTGRMYATVDGTMQINELRTMTETGPAPLLTTDARYQLNLGSVARFSQPADNQLQLHFGSPTAGTLLYKRSP
ncbi:hypothetical protein GCM10027578_33030 [Spirosoma luteolum]